eukprot:gene12723-12853_t
MNTNRLVGSAPLALIGICWQTNHVSPAPSARGMVQHQLAATPTPQPAADFAPPCHVIDSRQELSLLRWACNSSSVTPPGHATRRQYKQATALEVLVAHLYLTDGSRLGRLMDWLLDPQRALRALSGFTAGSAVSENKE